MTGEEAVRQLLLAIGEDPAREGLLDTPARVVRAMRETCSGYSEDPAAILARDFHGEGYDQMIVCRNIDFTSTCEHHLLPFSGVAHVAYIPKQRVVGLSKLARLVDCFAKRLQIQERLTEAISTELVKHLEPLGAAVMITARHLCMSCRGVKKQRAEMVTTSLKGVFRNAECRAEFLSLCR